MMWFIWTPWGPIQFHFCADEALMLMMFLGASGGFVAWVRAKFKRHEKQCCKHGDDTHV